jgi:hypothetical protein
MCCGKETYEEVKQGRVGLTRRKVLRAMGVGTGLITLGGLTACTQLLGLDQGLMDKRPNGVLSTAGSDDGLVYGNQRAVLSTGNEKITAVAVSWRDQLHGFDIIFNSLNAGRGIHNRILAGNGNWISYTSSQDDLLTIRSKIAPGQLQRISEAVESMDIRPSDLVDLLDPKKKSQIQEKITRNFERAKAKYRMAFRGHSLSINWKGQNMPIAPLVYSDGGKASKQLVTGLQKDKGNPLWTLGDSLLRLIEKNKEFALQTASTFPSVTNGASSQGRVEGQFLDPCSACALGVAGLEYGKWNLLRCAFGIIGCVTVLVPFAIGAVLTASSCSGCAGGGNGGGTTNEDPPPPSGCSPTCPEP